MPNTLDSAMDAFYDYRRDYFESWKGMMSMETILSISYFHAITEASHKCSIRGELINYEFHRRNPGGIQDASAVFNPQLGGGRDRKSSRSAGFNQKECYANDCTRYESFHQRGVEAYT